MLLSFLTLRGFPFQGKANLEFGPIPDAALDLNITAMSPHNTVSHGQSQSGSLFDIFGGKKRHENLL